VGTGISLTSQQVKGYGEWAVLSIQQTCEFLPEYSDLEYCYTLFMVIGSPVQVTDSTDPRKLQYICLLSAAQLLERPDITCAYLFKN